MKISKLFHWLYALLMLLPAFFVGGRMAYTIFNKNAKDSYSGANGYSIQYKWETNEVNTIADVEVGNIYLFTLDTNNLPTANYSFFRVSFVSYVFIDENNQTSKENINAETIGNNAIYIQFVASSQSLNFKDNDTGQVFGSIPVSRINDINIVYLYGLSNDYVSWLSESTYNEIEGVEISNLGTLDNAFDYSMSQLNELPLFSWAKDSFIVEPFTYITGLFGMPSDSPVLTLLSYWCSISLIWLTFDLLMYVPLLVHRWLDKGVLE